MAVLRLDDIRAQIEKKFSEAIANMKPEDKPIRIACGKFDFKPRNKFELEIFRNEGI